jgi:hypothetical protein
VVGLVAHDPEPRHEHERAADAGAHVELLVAADDGLQRLVAASARRRRVTEPTIFVSVM